MQKVIEEFFRMDSHNDSATLMVTLCTFVTGYFLAALFFISSRYLSRKSHRKMFLYNLLSLYKSVEAQEKGFDSTKKALNFEKNTQWVYDKVDFFQIATFREMTYKESFNSFFNGFENQVTCRIKKSAKRKAFIKVWSIISNVEFWSKKSLDDFTPFAEKYNRHSDDRNAAVQELRQIWERLFSQDPNQLNSDEIEYLNGLHQIVMNYAQILTLTRRGPYITHRQLVLRMRFLNKHYSHIAMVREVSDQCMKASGIYIDMEHMMRVMKSQYQTFYLAAREFRRQTKIIIKILA